RKSHINGTATKNGGSDFLFPVGYNGVYGGVKGDFAGPMTVGYSFSSEGYEEDVMPSVDPEENVCAEENTPGIASVSGVEMWSIPNAMSNVTVYWDGGSNRMNSEDPEAEWNEDNVCLAFWSGTCWRNLQATSHGNAESGYMELESDIPAAAKVASRCITMGFSATFSPLPIELVEFSAECNGTSARISWITASERNNEYFVLERSADAVNFHEISKIAGAGNSIETLYYEFTDNNMPAGDNYYRLVQVDFGGERSYSEIISLACRERVGEPELTVFPNPSASDFNIKLDNFDDEVEIEIIDMLGCVVYQGSFASCGLVNINPNLPSAAYTLRVKSGKTVVSKMIVKK
ncbi:MAG: T9SS type A sorting domain-containing protein, partial [Bacteroidales bacterium]|nr:T9SS type A sorting domain-containing protein [Bacteroidales bacterium]